MSQNGFIVFTATPEMAKQTNRALRAGVTYAAQPVKVAKQDETAPDKPTQKASTKTAKVKVKASKPAKAPKATKKAASAKVKASKPAKAPKATKRTAVKPDAIIKFVRENDGCNMTDIEQATKAPQAKLRRMLNAARDAGHITTTGQRRGLRYHIGAATTEPVASGSDSN